MFIKKPGKCVLFMLLFCCSTFFIFSESDFGLIRKSLLLFSTEPPCIFLNDTKIILETVKNVTNCENNFQQFKFKKKGDYWVAYNYVISTKRFKCQESVTYVTQSDFTFLNNVIPLVKRWRGPISIALHAPGSDFNFTLESIFYLRSCIPLVKKYVTFHLYFHDEHFPEGELPSHDTVMEGTYNCSFKAPFENVNRSELYLTKNNLTYPINLGRNIARSMAETHYVLTSDIELYPSLGLIPRFLTMVAECNMLKLSPVVFPLQVFEVETDVTVPNNKSELQSLLKKKLAVPFHHEICPPCHDVPESDNWQKHNENENMRVFHVARRMGRYYHWEPFYIGTKTDPEFDERLSWEGMSDKIVQAYALCLLDYSFLILDNAFLVHRPGIKKSNPNEKKWRQGYVNETNNLINDVVLPEIHQKYGKKYGCEL